MVLRLNLGSSLIRKYKKSGLIYLPDFIVYDIGAEEYQAFWNGVKSSSQKPLYTDGIQVYRVSWLTELFQKFKGWLGFENRCDPKKAELTLSKIAYYGYLRGFNTQGIPQTLIAPQFQNLICSNRTAQNSATLQQMMISHYMTYAESFPIHVNQTYPFGQSLVKEGLYPLFPKLDPQDSDFILKTIRKMTGEKIYLTPNTSFKENHFAAVYANFLTGQNYCREALHWFPPIAHQYKKTYIAFYLSQKDRVPEAAAQAMALIAALDSSPQEQDQKEAMDYINNNFSFEEQVHYLAPYPQLKTKIAKGYVLKAEQEYNKHAIIKRIHGNQNLLHLLERAVKFDPTILDQKISSQVTALKKEWVNHLANNERDIKRVKDLFEKNPQFEFAKNIKSDLKGYYSKELENKMALIKKALGEHNCELALQTVEECLIIANHMARLTPEEHPVIRYTIEQAKTILAVDQIKHSNVKEADLKTLQKAQQMLQELTLMNKNHKKLLTSSLNDILERQVNCLIECIRVPILFDSPGCADIRTEFIAQHQSQIDKLQQCLSTLINLNKDDKEMRPLLAKAYFLKADIIHFFERNKTASLPYFEKAMKIMPTNNYYCFHYYDLIRDKKRDAIEAKMKTGSDFPIQRYHMWLQERWNDERVMSEGVDIHKVFVENSGWFSNLFSR